MLLLNTFPSKIPKSKWYSWKHSQCLFLTVCKHRIIKKNSLNPVESMRIITSTVLGTNALKCDIQHVLVFHLTPTVVTFISNEQRSVYYYLKCFFFSKDVSCIDGSLTRNTRLQHSSSTYTQAGATRINEKILNKKFQLNWGQTFSTSYTTKKVWFFKMKKRKYNSIRCLRELVKQK